jgi:hypothetical protein
VPPPSTNPGGGASASTSASPTTLTGVVAEGVEAGCLLIDNYLLVGGDRDIVRAGARITVRGRVDRTLLTTCQQGTPFVVSSAQPA